ncbi:hypothetical protein RB620_18145 [Paenibacillus sp. LHD-117]|uniref:hypothetical protein n=1 Tax=Paenibacillus sp. LHD-117 TaxID=3071412 RepID=UPI0027E1CFC0|nr:hypothetical protein [Paenibacillus sp. LHD-117]MDQ6421351.1 hypothetical protein [Paenibacillus sp. LHD-117]
MAKRRIKLIVVPLGILWRNGISESDVMLISTENNNFRHYLYIKDGKPAGVMTLQKREKYNFWSRYYNTQDISTTNSTPNVTLIQSFHPLYKDNHLTWQPVWGGVVSLNKGEYQSVKIRTKNELRDPTAYVKAKDSIYFFFDAPDMTMDDKIEILPQK